jgi:hypothetical protein
MKRSLCAFVNLLPALLIAGTLAGLVWIQQGLARDLADLRAVVAIAAEPPAPSELSPEERVLDLPEDGHTWHTILILRPEWRSLPAERRAEAMFHTEPLLASLRHQTHWHLMTTDQAEFQKFRALVNATPCLLVERANGEVVYRESGPELARRPHALTHAIRREIERHCPDGRCLPLHPLPDAPDRNNGESEIPAVLREESRPAQRNPPVGALFAGALGLAGGIAAHWRRSG